MHLTVNSSYTRSTTIVIEHLAELDSSWFFFVDTKDKLDIILKLVETKTNINSTVVADMLHLRKQQSVEINQTVYPNVLILLNRRWKPYGQCFNYSGHT
jgi:hypothetical protein